MKRNNKIVFIYALLIVCACGAVQFIMIWRKDIDPYLYLLLMGIQASMFFTIKGSPIDTNKEHEIE